MATPILSLSSAIKANLLSASKVLNCSSVRHLNANRAVVTKIKRNLFERTYPALLVAQDGSTIEIKYPEPKLVLKMPIRFEDCNPELQKLIKQRRMPKGTIKVEKEIDFAFDPMKYVK